MPYFNVYLSNTVSREFIVQAENRDAAEIMVLEAAAEGQHDYRKMISVRHDTQNSVNVQDADRSDWDQALKKRKVK